MGFIATVTVLLDTLDMLKRDPEIGESLYSAVLESSCYRRPVAVKTPAHMEVIEVHHCDRVVPVLVGGNMGTAMDLSLCYSVLNHNEKDRDIAFATAICEKHGYKVSLKATKKAGK